jgi:hypothetical protein
MGLSRRFLSYAPLDLHCMKAFHFMHCLGVSARYAHDDDDADDADDDAGKRKETSEARQEMSKVAGVAIIHSLSTT